jgi:hypothetical protein
MRLPRHPRWLNHLWAGLAGYFWLPCPLCGKEFGGHEWDGRSICGPQPDGHGIGYCWRHDYDEIRVNFDPWNKRELAAFIHDWRNDVQALGRSTDGR